MFERKIADKLFNKNDVNNQIKTTSKNNLLSLAIFSGTKEYKTQKSFGLNKNLFNIFEEDNVYTVQDKIKTVQTFLSEANNKLNGMPVSKEEEQKQEALEQAKAAAAEAKRAIEEAKTKLEKINEKNEDKKTELEAQIAQMEASVNDANDRIQLLSNNLFLFNKDKISDVVDEVNDIETDERNLDGEEWEDVDFKEDSALGKITYTTSDGTQIFVDDNDGVIIKQNKETGEIVVVNAKNANIRGNEEKDVKISIYNSDVEDIEMGIGNDTIKIENSKVGNISGSFGNDNIEINNSTVKKVNGDNDNDTISINASNVEIVEGNNGIDKIKLDKSTADNISGGNGNDFINIENSSVKKADGGNDDDDIYTLNSDVISILGGNGDDNFIVDSTSANSIDAGAGNDIVSIKKSENIGYVFGGDGDDIITADNSTISLVDGGKGNNDISQTDSNIAEIERNNRDINKKEDKKAESTDIIDKVDEVTEEQAQVITEGKTSKYKNGEELTPEEQTQALVINFFTENLENMKKAFEEQEKEDGAISDGYNIVKELMDLGISDKDIKAAIQEQEQMIEELTAALNGENNESFEQVFKRWTGIEYNQETVIDYYETAQMYSIATNGISKSINLDNSIKNGENLEEVFQAYIEYFGSEDKAREELNKLLKEVFDAGSEAYFNQQVYINEDNQVVRYFPDEDKTEVSELYEINNMFKSMSIYYDADKYQKEFINNLETTLGKSFDELQNEYKEKQLNALGYGNSFQKLIDKYCADQQGFTQKLATACQVGGIGLMVIGGVVTFVCPPVGAAILNTGKYAALFGTFGDNAMDLIDDLTSENGLSKEEGWDLIKETAKEIALLYSGAKINGIAEGVQDIVLNETQSKVLAILSELGTDMTLSTMADYIITGDVSLTGEGLSALLSLLSGLAGAKIKSHNNQSISEADALYKNNNPDAAYELLKSKGFSDKKIYKLYKDAELSRLADLYKQTGDWESTLAQAKNSKILGYKTNEIEAILKNSLSDAEINKFYEMLENGVDKDAVIKQAEQSKILSEKQIESIRENLDVRNTLDILKKDFGFADADKLKKFDFSSNDMQALKHDIEMLKTAYEKGIDVNDLMVPTVDNINAGLASVKVGDVFEVQGSKNIFVKTADGSYKELNMSKETYCRLFPPVDRFSSGQQSSGDCYLVSALNKMMSNPEAREKLYSCITENEDGSISAIMPGSDSQVTIKPDETITDLGIEDGKYINCALGMQLLECLYKVDLKMKAYMDIQNKLDIQSKDILDFYNNHKAFFDKLGVDGTDTDEIRNAVFNKFTEISKECNSKFNVELDEYSFIKMFDIAQRSKYCNLDTGKLTEEGLTQLQYWLQIEDTEKIQEIFSYVFEQNSDNIGVLCLAGEFLEKFEKYQETRTSLENANSKSFEEYGGYGGNPAKVFKAFGYEDAKEILSDSDDFDKLLKDILDNPDKYMATAASRQTKEQLRRIYNDPNNELYEYYHMNQDEYAKLLNEAPLEKDLNGIVGNHAFGFEVARNSNGEIVIKVTNPWATSDKYKVLTLTPDEFKTYFDKIQFVKID